MKKKIFLIIVLFCLFSFRGLNADTVAIPMFNYLKENNFKTGIKELYILDDNFGQTKKIWELETDISLNYGLTNEFELGMCLPYTNNSELKKSGTGDMEADIKWWFFSSKREDFYYDYNLDLILGFGGKFRTGEKDIRSNETDAIISFMVKYDLGIYYENKNNLFFNIRRYLPIEGKYIQERFFKYDLGVESQFNDKLSIFLEINGENSSEYEKIFITPGLKFGNGKNWDVTMGAGSSVSAKENSLNTKSSIRFSRMF